LLIAYAVTVFINKAIPVTILVLIRVCTIATIISRSCVVVASILILATCDFVFVTNEVPIGIVQTIPVTIKSWFREDALDGLVQSDCRVIAFVVASRFIQTSNARREFTRAI
jgi:hypothetical protein